MASYVYYMPHYLQRDTDTLPATTAKSLSKLPCVKQFVSCRFGTIVVNGCDNQASAEPQTELAAFITPLPTVRVVVALFSPIARNKNSIMGPKQQYCSGPRKVVSFAQVVQETWVCCYISRRQSKLRASQGLCTHRFVWKSKQAFVFTILMYGT